MLPHALALPFTQRGPFHSILWCCEGTSLSSGQWLCACVFGRIIVDLATQARPCWCRLYIVASGHGSPCLDLRRVSADVADATVGADLGELLSCASSLFPISVILVQAVSSGEAGPVVWWDMASFTAGCRANLISHLQQRANRLSWLIVCNLPCNFAFVYLGKHPTVLSSQLRQPACHPLACCSGDRGHGPRHPYQLQCQVQV